MSVQTHSLTNVFFWFPYIILNIGYRTIEKYFYTKYVHLWWSFTHSVSQLMFWFVTQEYNFYYYSSFYFSVCNFFSEFQYIFQFVCFYFLFRPGPTKYKNRIRSYFENWIRIWRHIKKTGSVAYRNTMILL